MSERREHGGRKEASAEPAPPSPGTGHLGRWWTYQAERFPLVQHAPLVAAFSYSAVCFSALLRANDASFTMPGIRPGLTAFICCLGLFLQLRIADEHKDFEEDARFRPYRPVPRGLVSLRGLTLLGCGVAVAQTLVAAALQPALLVLLVITWAYFALMTKEFFVRAWLTRRPLLYMLSHMAIMPLIDLFATGCDWMSAGARPPVAGLTLFLAASYFNGVVIETGRKIRAPEDEEHGVQTYSALWGRPVAVASWLAAMIVAGSFAIAASSRIGFLLPVTAFVIVAVTSSALIGVGFLRGAGPGAGKRIELVSGVWVILLYLFLGIIPAAQRALA